MCDNTVMTKLAAYMKDRSPPKTQADWGALFGISRNYLSEIASGAKSPSLEVAVRIERATGGAVPASSWIESPAASDEEAAPPDAVAASPGEAA